MRTSSGAPPRSQNIRSPDCEHRAQDRHGRPRGHPQKRGIFQKDQCLSAPACGHDAVPGDRHLPAVQKRGQGAYGGLESVRYDERDVSFSYRTDRAYLSELLEDEKKDLKPEMEEGSYGKFVAGLLGIRADPKKEYFKVDGRDAVTGVSRLPLEDGRTYTFTLSPL